LDEVGQAPDFRVVAIDPSEWELRIAKARIADQRVTFFQGRAQEAVGTVRTGVDAVLLCSVLHQIPLSERQAVLEGAFTLLRPGGMVGANTLFYDGGVEPNTRNFYLRWMLEARALLARTSVRWTPPAATPVALQLLSAQQHRELLESVGFEAVEIEEIDLDWRLEDWEALSNYSVFIQGALSPDIDLAIGSRALVEGLRETYRAMGIDTVRRRWLHCAARRPE
jgi:ubiquinone/menaquinone biosynthesis C-methylase UbiE